MAKFTSRKLAYSGSEEFRGCLRVREGGFCWEIEDDAEGPLGVGEMSDVSSSTKAVMVSEISGAVSTILYSKFLVD